MNRICAKYERTCSLRAFFKLHAYAGKSFSEALILASTNPNTKNIVHEITMKTTCAEHGQNMGRTCSAHVLRL